MSGGKLVSISVVFGAFYALMTVITLANWIHSRSAGIPIVSSAGPISMPAEIGIAIPYATLSMLLLSTPYFSGRDVELTSLLFVSYLLSFSLACLLILLALAHYLDYLVVAGLKGEVASFSLVAELSRPGIYAGIATFPLLRISYSSLKERLRIRRS